MATGGAAVRSARVDAGVVGRLQSGTEPGARKGGSALHAAAALRRVELEGVIDEARDMRAGEKIAAVSVGAVIVAPPAPARRRRAVGAIWSMGLMMASCCVRAARRGPSSTRSSIP